MSEKLIVKNFGPIKHAEIDIKKVTIFIGEQAGGKSTLAKLVAVGRNLDVVLNAPHKVKKYLKEFRINNFLREDSSIEFIGSQHKIKIPSSQADYPITQTSETSFLSKYWTNKAKTYNEIKEKIEKLDIQKNIAIQDDNVDLIKKIESDIANLHKERSLLLKDFWNAFNAPLYYPTERHLIHSISGALFGFSQSQNPISIPENLKRFGSLYEQAQDDYDSLNFESFDLKLNTKNKTINYKQNSEIDILDSSSGIQSLLPILLVTDYFIGQQFVDKTLYKKTTFSNYSFIIEEPELNLYPTTQRNLVKYLVEKCTKDKNSLIITTHSPYILSTFDNCIHAGNTVKEKPETKEEVEKLIPSKYHLNYDDVAVYYVADGTVKSIMDEEYQGIDTNAIDDVSEDMGDVFSKLLTLKYQD